MAWGRCRRYNVGNSGIEERIALDKDPLASKCPTAANAASISQTVLAPKSSSRNPLVRAPSCAYRITSGAAPEFG